MANNDWMLRRQDWTVDSNVFQKTADYPDELATAVHVVLDDGDFVTVTREQMRSKDERRESISPNIGQGNPRRRRMTISMRGRASAISMIISSMSLKSCGRFLSA